MEYMHSGVGTLVPSKGNNGVGVLTPLDIQKNGTEVPAPKYLNNYKENKLKKIGNSDFLIKLMKYFYFKERTKDELINDLVASLKQDLDILKEMYRSGELSQEATTQKIRVVQKEGMQNVKREVDFYKLDARKYYSKIYLEGIVCKTKPTF